MQAIVVGAGGPTRAVLERLSERWEVVVIDPDGERLARAAALRPITMVEGDGSSRVVLERAGLHGADAVIAATLVPRVPDDPVPEERRATNDGPTR